MWGCNMVWDNGGYQWVPVHSKDYNKWYEIYFSSKGISRANYVSIITEAIKKWEADKKIKQELTANTLKTFGELIDEL